MSLNIKCINTVYVYTKCFNDYDVQKELLFLFYIDNNRLTKSNAFVILYLQHLNRK